MKAVFPSSFLSCFLWKSPKTKVERILNEPTCPHHLQQSPRNSHSCFVYTPNSLLTQVTVEKIQVIICSTPLHQ
jgi:hypothetical protein